MIKFSHANNSKLTQTFVHLEIRILCREALLLQISKVQHPCAQYKYLYQELAHLFLRIWVFSGSLPCKLLTSSTRMLLVKSDMSLGMLWKKWKFLPIWEYSSKTVMISQEVIQQHSEACCLLRYILSHKKRCVLHRVAFSI